MMTSEKFKNMVWSLADKVAVKPKEIHIRKMTKKWASCSSKGRLTFSNELMNKPRKFRLEAILHELLHLKYPSHGRMFKIMLRAYLSQLGING
jgi:predicted metal-dependent hydrolase